MFVNKYLPKKTKKQKKPDRTYLPIILNFVLLFSLSLTLVPFNFLLTELTSVLYMNLWLGLMEGNLIPTLDINTLID